MISRVVLVDDLQEIRQILAVMLEQSGWFQVVGEASDGPAGIELVAATRPDLVVLDVEMPGPNGWTVLPDIKAAAPGVDVVILSGTRVDDPTVPEAARRLASAVLQKGMPTGDLIDALLAIVRGERPAAPATPRLTRRPALAWKMDVPEAPGPEEIAARLAALVTSSPDAIIGTTLEGRIASWNPAAEHIYGFAADEVLGRTAAMLVPPDRTGELASIVDRLFEGEHVQHLETVHQRRDGSRVDIGLTVSLVRAADGSVIGLSGIARDLSARRRSDTALAQAVAQLEHQNRELRRSNEELDTFAAIASHDLAQPLQVASGYLEMFERQFGDQLDPVGREWVDAAIHSMGRMRGLVRDILQYARTADPEVAPGHVDLGDVAGTALQFLDALVAERQAVVSIEQLPVVVGHRSQLTQLLQNLIGNAVKFVPAGTIPVVRVSAQATHEGWLVSVADNGPGIPAADRERVFEMFKRGPSGGVTGTGLGLAICRKLAHRHGGRVWVSDDPSGGAVFNLLLPFAGEER